ncbi:MAG: hypothetical protein ACREHD_10035, partial [Pirellulales bacterium]
MQESFGLASARPLLAAQKTVRWLASTFFMHDPDPELANELLAFVGRPKYRPAKPRQLAKKLNVPEHRWREFKRLIKDLVKQGKLSYADKHRILPPLAAPDGSQKRRAGEGLITGVFRRNQAGFGFVRPAGTLPGAGREQDIYIAAGDAGDAASGDVVLVRLLKGGRKDRAFRGAITEIIERETHQFVGVYFERGGRGWVQVDGTLFMRPIYVGDPGAK